MLKLPKGIKIIVYIFVAIISFVVFLYLTFPFDILKDRILDGVDKSFKGKYELSVSTVSPRLLFGLTLKGVKFVKRDEGVAVPVWEAEKVKLKTSIFSLMAGNPTVKFDVRSGKGQILGKVNNDKNISKIYLRLEDVDLGKITYLASKYGLQIKSNIDGEVNLSIDPKQIIRSSGTIDIRPNAIKLLPSKVKAGAMGEMDLSDITIGAGKSLISAELTKGAIKIKTFVLEGGDLNLNLNGLIYLSTNVQNFRLNLTGSFTFSDNFGKALPFLFIIEKQKKEDGTFPITIAGRISKPQIKIGDFTIPL